MQPTDITIVLAATGERHVPLAKNAVRSWMEQSLGMPNIIVVTDASPEQFGVTELRATLNPAMGNTRLLITTVAPRDFGRETFRNFDGGIHRNAGLRDVRTPWVAMVDGDCVWPVDALEKIFQAIEAHGDPHYYQSSLVRVRKGEMSRVSDPVTEYDKLLQVIRDNEAEKVAKEPDKTRIKCVDGTRGGITVFRTRNGRYTGGYQRNYNGWGWEDGDFWQRLEFTGLSFKEIPGLIALHQYHSREFNFETLNANQPIMMAHSAAFLKNFWIPRARKLRALEDKDVWSLPVVSDYDSPEEIWGPAPKVFYFRRRRTGPMWDKGPVETVNPFLKSQTIGIIEPHDDDAWLSLGGLMLKLKDTSTKIKLVTCSYAPGINDKHESTRLAEFMPAVHNVQLQYKDIVFVPAEREICIRKFLEQDGPDYLYELINPYDLFGHYNEPGAYDAMMKQIIQEMQDVDVILAPIGLQHPMHRLVGQSAALISEVAQKPLLFYADTPYYLKSTTQEELASKIADLIRCEIPIPDVEAKARIFQEVYGSQTRQFGVDKSVTKEILWRIPA